MAKKKSEKLTYEQILNLFKETEKLFKETDQQIKENARQLEEVKKLLAEKTIETEKKIQETDRILTEKFQDTDKRFKETDKKLRQLESLFVGQWGKLIESLVNGNLDKLLIERGIDISITSQRVKAKHKGKIYKFDIVAHNGDDIVVVEVKTTLKVEHIKEFIDELKVYKQIYPEYKRKNVYGAVAFLVAEEDADKYAYKQGLFVIKATAESARIMNDKKFKPKKW